MTKIKANEGYELWKHIGGGKFHITKVNAEDYLCGSTVVATMVDTCNLDDLCGHCAKHRDAYTEIPEHIAAMPDGMRIMEVGEEITKECMLWEYGDGPWVKEGELLDTHVENYHVPHCCPIETQSYHSTCCTCGGTVGDAQDRIAELEKKATNSEWMAKHGQELRNAIATNLMPLDGPCGDESVLEAPAVARKKIDELSNNIKGKEQSLIAVGVALEHANAKVAGLEGKLERMEVSYKEAYVMFEIENKTRVEAVRKTEELSEELRAERVRRDGYQKRVEELEAIISGPDPLVEKITTERDGLRNATNGHTLENITTMMQAMPPAEELEGYELEWMYNPHEGDSILKLSSCNAEWITAACDWDNPMIWVFRRTPIVEYLHTEDVTNALIQSVNGQIECEFKEGSHSRWEDGKLLACLSEEFAPFAVLVDGLLATPLEVRIRKETIERLRIAAAE